MILLYKKVLFQLTKTSKMFECQQANHCRAVFREALNLDDIKNLDSIENFLFQWQSLYKTIKTNGADNISFVHRTSLGKKFTQKKSSFGSEKNSEISDFGNIVGKYVDFREDISINFIESFRENIGKNKEQIELLKNTNVSEDPVGFNIFYFSKKYTNPKLKKT